MSLGLILFFGVPAVLLALATQRRVPRLAGGGDPVAAAARVRRR